MRTLPVLFMGLAAGAIAQGPKVDAKSAIIVDERSGVVVWQRDANAIRYPASITKVLTALLLLERTEPDELITAPADCEKVEGSSLYLKPGEEVSASDMLKAILLRSANDACHAIAVHIAGSDAEFAKLMNQKARELGCKRTHFVNPHGLHHDKHYSTAADMAILAREAMKHPEIRQVVATRKAKIERSINSQDTFLISKNKWLAHDASADGIKTGYTKVARATFMGSATRNGCRFLTVILASEEWQADQQAMINWAFANFQRSVVRRKGDRVGEAAVRNGEFSVPAVLDADLHYAHRIGAEPHLEFRFEPKPNLAAPIEAGEEIGTVTVTDGKGWVVERPAFAESAIAAKPLLSGNPTWLLGAIVLGGSTLLVRRRSRRMGASLGSR